MRLEKATVGGGCFWCTEAAMKELDGVRSVTSGYAGGETDNPTYREVCSGSTGHAEVVQVSFNPAEITYEDILRVFFSTHDPTQVNRQGPDVGTQYRSIVLYHSDDQAHVARSVMQAVASRYEAELATELDSLTRFWEAEQHHQDYFEKNPRDAYCRAHVQPKVEKVQKEFS
jgi:methionine-S-sulfoxide reductase